MRLLQRSLLIGLILAQFGGTSLTAQSYYVALVRGQVFYDNIPVKPRMKIELRGKLRFTAKDDYIKVSGPGGIHTIRPAEKAGGGYEFLRAVTQELFPRAQAKGSFALATFVAPGDAVNLYDDNQYKPQYYLAGERRPVEHILKSKDYDRLHWVYRTTTGEARAVPALVIEDELVLDPAVFRNPDGELLAAGPAYLYAVRDLERLREAIDRFDLETLYVSTNMELNRFRTEENGPPPLNDRTATAAFAFFPDLVSLTTLAHPDGLLPSDSIFAEMHFFLQRTDDNSLADFVNKQPMGQVDGYGQVLRESYGEMNLERVTDAFSYYLSDQPELSARLTRLVKEHTVRMEHRGRLNRKDVRANARRMRRKYYRLR